MANVVARYARWLHTQWPAGTVEKLPEIAEDGSTNVDGVYVVGDLSGIPLLKFSLDGGARVIGTILDDPAFRNAPASDGVIDILIVGAGVAGMAAAVEAKKRKRTFRVFEATESFSTIVNFPKAKPIYTYPREMTPQGDLQVTAQVKEALVEELEAQVKAAGVVPEIGRVETIRRDGALIRVTLAGGAEHRARAVVVAIGRSGNFRSLNVPGENLDKVSNRLHDPMDFSGRNVLVVGGGDSALEAAIALAQAGAHVVISYRRAEFSRPKPDNVEKLRALAADPMADVSVEQPVSERVTTASVAGLGRRPGSITLKLPSEVKEIREDSVDLVTKDGPAVTIPNDNVFLLIGREAPLEFFRRNGLRVAGDMRPKNWAMLGLFLAFCTWLYNWKSGGRFGNLWYENHWFPTNLGDLASGLALDPHGLAGIAVQSASSPSFWYTLAYSLLVVIFGVQRIRRRKTPYVKAQTLTLMAVQVLPLFLLPEILLPWMNYHGFLPQGLADGLFPVVDYGHGREFWRAYGLILAWPLMVYNIFTDQPLWWWVALGSVQTFVLIPLAIRYWGKGAYCGWICSCGALAETLGDTHRHKMPHGARWNRLNMIGQGVLAVAFVMLFVRIAGWIWPGSPADRVFGHLKDSYKWIVDVTLAGIVGYGAYFWYSGRTWCRFLCPLAALMHIYARFSRFRILADKKKCISCNVCTSVCHQGIDIMNFANKGRPMADPECVRCSACVQMCPTGVLSFGQVDGNGNVVARDRLAASPVAMREG